MVVADTVGMPADGRFQAEVRIEPSARVELIDVQEQLAREFGADFTKHPKALYVSHHTTAGYLDERLAARLKYDGKNVRDFLQVFHKLFPPGAG